MSEFLKILASESFIPHGHCYLWQPGLVWLHILSDGLIALAYYSIPTALLYFVRKRQDLPFNRLVLLFGAFIIACGTTHLMEIWTLWHPIYWLAGLLKALTAIVSLYTAFELVILMPQVIAFPSLAATNKKLAREVGERKSAEEAQHRYAQRVQGINTISRAILAQQSSKETAQVALWHLRRLVACQWAIVALFDFEKNQAEVIAADMEDQLIFPNETLLPLDCFSEFDQLRHDAVYVYSRENIAALEHSSVIMQQLLAVGIHRCMAVPLFIEGKLIGQLLLADSGTAGFDPETEEIAVEVAGQLALAIQKACLLEQTQTDRERLQTLSTRLMEAQETERRHIARELHDEIGQALTAVKINLQDVERSSPPSPAPLQDSISIVEVALQQVRNLSLDLRPSILDDLGLVAALRWYVDRFSQRTGVSTKFSSDLDLTLLSPRIETACFRIVQEALTNVMRHAQAQRLTVELCQQPETLHLLICDNGIGFDVQAARERATRGNSLGLLGMEERALLVGGHFTITSTPNQETRIEVAFPMVAYSSEQDDDVEITVS
jgi:signal transduction histidine kinase